MLLPWSTPSEGEEAIIEVTIITLKGNLDHLINQSQELGMESVGFVVRLATQRKIVKLTRNHKKK